MPTLDSRDLMVTIRCLVYNHEPYLRQCLDGFVMQQTNFRFEAIVHDDASTDGSAAIIREYAAKYPDIIKPIYETENQYSKRDGSIRRVMDAHTHGKYLASCEGDDYWTDPLKLQKQVDFMEAHPDFSLCTHHCNEFEQESQTLLGDWNAKIKDDLVFDLDYYISRKTYITQTLTLLYRRASLKSLDCSRYKGYKDLTLMYILLKQGKGMFLKDNMATYRRHKGGVWMGSSKDSQVKSEINTVLGIYDVEKSIEAARFLRVSVYNLGYIGFKFLRKHYKDYNQVSKIVYNELGFMVWAKTLFHSFNVFHNYFGY